MDSKEFVSYFTYFTNSREKDENCRYYSFDHCRKAFLELLNKQHYNEYMALHLYAFLANWGMLRNSMLSQKDYKFLVLVVEILCKYRALLDFINPFDDKNVAELSTQMMNQKKILYLQ